MQLVSENITVTNPLVRRALEERKTAPIDDVIRAATEAGAAHLDVNLGSGDISDKLEFVLDRLAQIWRGGVWLDTTDSRAAEFAARNYKELPLTLNGYCPGRDGVLEVAADYGLDLTVFLMEGARVAADTGERLALAAELVGNCSEKGLGPDKLIIDPLLVPMGWMNGQELNSRVLEVVRALPELFGPDLRSVVGLSNIVTGSTGQRRVRWLEEVFLAAAFGAGLTHVMLDVTNPALVKLLKALEVLENSTPFAPDEFIDAQ